MEDKASCVPAGTKAPGPVPETKSVERSPIPLDRVGFGLEEDFRQLSEEAPSEGLTTIPVRERQVKKNYLGIK